MQGMRFSLKFWRAVGSSLLQLLLIKVLKILFQLSSALDIALAAAEAAEDCSTIHYQPKLLVSAEHTS